MESVLDPNLAAVVEHALSLHLPWCQTVSQTVLPVTSIGGAFNQARVCVFMPQHYSRRPNHQQRKTTPVVSMQGIRHGHH